VLSPHAPKSSFPIRNHCPKIQGDGRRGTLGAPTMASFWRHRVRHSIRSLFFIFSRRCTWSAIVRSRSRSILHVKASPVNTVPLQEWQLKLPHSLASQQRLLPYPPPLPFSFPLAPLSSRVKQQVGGINARCFLHEGFAWITCTYGICLAPWHSY